MFNDDSIVYFVINQGKGKILTFTAVFDPLKSMQSDIAYMIRIIMTNFPVHNRLNWCSDIILACIHKLQL